MMPAFSPSLAHSIPLAENDVSWRARLMHWLAGARAHRVICLVLAIWLLNGFDLTFTILAHEQGSLQEQNPLARRFLADGPLSVTLFKVGLVLIGSYPLLRYRRARITEMATLIILMAYGLLAVHWSEYFRLSTITSGTPVHVAELSTLPEVWFP